MVLEEEAGPSAENNMGDNNAPCDWDEMGPFDDDYDEPMDEGNNFGPPVPMRGPPPPRGGRGFPRNFRNARYSNAYGNYRGGYGPGGGFGPPPGYYDAPGFYNGPPPPLMGQGFGPGGPPAQRYQFGDKALKYLIRCGVPKENLKNLPKKLLKLIDPEHCGLCGMHFDSFVMSRMHYISKNHFKKQKTYLRNLETASEIRRAKEVPLKARELYCELCDVQITSKSHADAHYAGKPHRSVVDGLRKPKNPILLQKGMESRVDQLIRREKRALKVAEREEVQPTEEEKKSTTPPELYCQICKTCVTCTEQMTMHLNGKKHLSKEKQHILKMMRGEAGSKKNEDEPEADNADEADELVKEEDEEKEKEEEKNTNDDWENNGEKWEDASIY